MTGGVERFVRSEHRIDLSASLGGLRRGPGDPTHRRIGTGPDAEWWRATRNSAGTVLLRLRPASDGVHARAWGAGAEAALATLPRLLGADDDPGGFAPRPEHRVLVESWRRNGHLRVGATDAVVEAMTAACLEQVVTGHEAYRGFRLLVREFGEPAPGPALGSEPPAAGMMVPPDGPTWAAIPTWRFLAAGVEERRSRPLVGAARRASALERTLGMDSAAADRALQSLPGIGPWTSAEVRQRAHGDADAWSIGDYHVGGWISHALTGEVLDDDACLELLEPYRGHRFRVQQLLAATGVRPERRGPRRSLPTHTPHATRGRS